jgi:hypothetical protein
MIVLHASPRCCNPKRFFHKMDNSQSWVIFIKADKKRKEVSWREMDNKAIKLRLLYTPWVEPPSDKGE